MLESTVIYPNGVQVVACPHPFQMRRERLDLPAGMTLNALLAHVQPDAFLRLRAHIFVNDQYIPIHQWDSILEDGDRVLVRVVPGEPVSLTAIFTALAAAWAVIKPIMTVISIILTVASLAMTLMSALIAPPTPGQAGGRKEDTTQFIQGARNRIEPYGVIARPLGRLRVVPKYGAMPYTEICGKEQYLRAIFCWGYGPMTIEELRIGQTPIGYFNDVEIETRQGYPDDEPLTLFPYDVFQADFAVVLKNGYHLTNLSVVVDATAKTFTRSAGSWLEDNKGNELLSAGENIDVAGFAAGSGNNGNFKVTNVTELVLTLGEAVGLENDTKTGISVTFDAWNIRTSAANADELSVDVVFFRGLYRANDDGGIDSISVDLHIQYRLVGGTEWLDGPPFELAASQSDPLSRWFPFLTSSSTPLWTVNTVIALNAFRRPLIGNGFEYECTSRSGDFTTGTVEPIWPVAIGGTVVDDQITWTCRPSNSKSTITGHSTQAVRVGVTWRVPRPDNNVCYEVQLKRFTKDRMSSRVGDEATWTALRTITNEQPIDFPGLALTAVRIRASNQLSGVIDDLNGVVTTICPDWDTATQTWIERATQNNASLYRHVLQGPANARPLADSRIDLVKLQSWHEQCAAQGRTFNGDLSGSVWEVLKQIAAAGRASPGIGDFGQRTVVMDEVQTLPVQHFTPRNSWGFSAEKVFVDMPHALRVQFPNQEKDWQADERMVCADGYEESIPNAWTAATVVALNAWRCPTVANGYKYQCVARTGAFETGAVEPAWPTTAGVSVVDNEITWMCAALGVLATKFETMEFVGITDSEQVWKEGRYHLAVAQLRPETYTLNADFEHLVCTRGDLVLASHDVTLWGLGAGRVKEVLQGDVDGIKVIGVLLDEVLTMEPPPKTYNLRIRRRDDSLLLNLQTIPGESNAVYFETPIHSDGELPGIGDLVMFGETARETAPCIVKSIERGPDLTAKLYLVDAAPEIHDADQGIIPPFDSLISIPAAWYIPTIIDRGPFNPIYPDRPYGLSIQSDSSVGIRNSNGSWSPRILIALTRPASWLQADIIQAEALFRPANTQGPWASVSALSADMAVILTPVFEGVQYEFRLRYVKADGSKGNWSELHYHTVVGGPESLPDIANLVAVYRDGRTALVWDVVRDMDNPVISYEIRKGDVWGSAEIMGQVKDPLYVLSGDGKYWVAAVAGLVYSTNPVYLLIVGAILNQNVVAEYDEQATGWTGTLTDCYVDGSGFLQLPYRLFCGAPDVFCGAPGVYCGKPGPVVSGGIYGIPAGHIVDVGEPMPCVVSVAYSMLGDNISALFDSEAMWDSDQMVDGSYAGLCGVKAQMQLAGLDGVFGSWQDFAPGTYVARKFNFQLLLTSLDVEVTPIVQSFTFLVDMPDRMETGNDLGIADTGASIIFTKPFQVAPNVQVSIIDAQAGDYYELSNITTTGFDLIVKNGGVGVHRHVNWLAKGY